MTITPTPTLWAMPAAAVAELPWEPLQGAPGVDNKVLYLGPGVVAGLLRFAPNAHESRHLHQHGEHHVWVLEGSVVVDDTALAAGSYLHVPERLGHTMRDVGSGSVVSYVFMDPAFR